MSVATVMLRSASWLEPSAVTAMPTSCSRSSRRCAVTTISSMPVLAPACCACTTAGVANASTAAIAPASDREFRMAAL